MLSIYFSGSQTVQRGMHVYHGEPTGVLHSVPDGLTNSPGTTILNHVRSLRIQDGSAWEKIVFTILNCMKSHKSLHRSRCCVWKS